jgi:hypothetical protein
MILGHVKLSGKHLPSRHLRSKRQKSFDAVAETTSSLLILFLKFKRSMRFLPIIRSHHREVQPNETEEEVINVRDIHASNPMLTTTPDKNQIYTAILSCTSSNIVSVLDRYTLRHVINLIYSNES